MLLYYLIAGSGLMANAGLPEGHPRIFTTEAERPALQEKINRTKWAKNIYDQLKLEVDPWVARHKTDPQYVISRMQMNWEEGKHYTKAWAEKNQIERREGNAEYPTVRLAAGRVGNGSRPALDQVKPYGNGDMLLWRGGKQVEVPFLNTGLAIEDLNKDILGLAYRAAIVYYFTGNEDYAKFAADIIWVFVRGASQQEQLNPGNDRDARGNILPFGFLSYETLGDSRRYATLPLTYDFIYNYLNKIYFDSSEFRDGRKGEELWAPGHKQGKQWGLEQFSTVFKKMVENKINRGGGLIGNWNLNEQASALLYAFAMDDNAQMKDGKGREYYIDYLLNKTTDGNGAYRDVIRNNLNPQTGLWPEAPSGYGQGSIQQLVEFGYWYHKQGIEILNDDPLLKKAARSFVQIAFPNGRTTAWGDGGYATVMTLQAELMIAYAREKGDKKLEEEFTALINFAGKRDFNGSCYMPLFFYVPELSQSADKIGYPRVSYSPGHALLIGRNKADDVNNALAYSVYGFDQDSGHYHTHGLAMELYGRGENLGCDFGAGPNYWDIQHRMFNHSIAAHNTVAVNGLEIGNKNYMPITINYADPMPVTGGFPAKETAADFQFSDVSTKLALSQVTADMRRVNGIVRLNSNNGFYIDILRVKITSGQGKTFDYLYHNMGTGMDYSSMTGQKLSGTVASLNPKSGFGYEYFTGVQGIKTDSAIKGFIPFGRDNIVMNFFLPGNSLERTFFAMKSPANFRHYDKRLRDTPVPTFMIRREDNDTWTKPFIVVYEPSGKGADAQIMSVKEISNAPGLAAIEVKLNDGKTVVILNSDNPEKLYQIGEIEFQGIYGVVTPDKLYLGHGTVLKCGTAIIKNIEPASREISRQ